MAVAEWLRIGERRAEKVVPAPYSKKKFQQALDQIRSFTVLPPSKWQSQLIELCANAGVAVVFVPAIPKSGVSGVARWLVSDKALIQLSLYEKTNDKLWFTFFHEAAHILLHAKKNIFLDNLDASINNALEEEANRYARDMLIPPAYVSKLRFLSSAEDIKSYAANLGIHPGIVVGRMQFDHIAPFDRWNHLKDRYEFVQSAG